MGEPILQPELRKAAHQTIVDAEVDLAGLSQVVDLLKVLGDCPSEPGEAQMLLDVH